MPLTNKIISEACGIPQMTEISVHALIVRLSANKNIVRVRRLIGKAYTTAATRQTSKCGHAVGT